MCLGPGGLSGPGRAGPGRSGSGDGTGWDGWRGRAAPCSQPALAPGSTPISGGREGRVTQGDGVVLSTPTMKIYKRFYLFFSGENN